MRWRRSYARPPEPVCAALVVVLRCTAAYGLWGGDDGAASAETDASGALDDTSEDDGSDDGVQDDAAEEGEATDADTHEAPDAEAGLGPADGAMVVGGNEFELDLAQECPPRDVYDPDNQYDSAERLVDVRATIEDREDAIHARELLLDGVLSHQVVYMSLGPTHEFNVEEGEPGFPAFEIEDGVIDVDGQTTPAEGEEPISITASWDVPEGFFDADLC